VGTALYMAAHPDDENTAMLAYLAKDRLVRAATCR
jgi:LmbE family N-acetylglucosaminyl deacetylase